VPCCAVSTQIAPVRIFVVDDSAAMRRSLQVLLEGHKQWKVCDEAANGREAVEKVEQASPDVIILDFRMPEMNGLDAAREIKQRLPLVPILMVTMHVSSQLTEEARKIGISGMCSKAEMHCLVQAVETLLNHGTYFRD